MESRQALSLQGGMTKQVSQIVVWCISLVSLFALSGCGYLLREGAQTMNSRIGAAIQEVYECAANAGVTSASAHATPPSARSNQEWALIRAEQLSLTMSMGGVSDSQRSIEQGQRILDAAYAALQGCRASPFDHLRAPDWNATFWDISSP